MPPDAGDKPRESRCEQVKKSEKQRELPLKKAVALCTGAGFWHTRSMKRYDIPSMFMCDGPHGLRRQEHGGGFDMLGVHPARPATCFPTAVTLAGSWNDALLGDVGRAIGEEALSHGVGMVLGPGVNIKRSPLCGRNFEYYSEDPYLSGKLAAAFIRGMQGTGVSACLKHYAANSQERERFISDSIIDERTLREIYLTAFEIAVRESRPGSVMCAYNKVNGEYCSDSRRLLTDILRDEWGFDGMVVTDWGAMHDRTAAFRAGCDLNMPGGHHFGERAALKAAKTGKLPAEYIYKSASRVAAMARRARRALSGAHVFDVGAHHELARRAACDGAVLLKNDGDMLPLKPGTRLAVIGHMARDIRYQGSGSSHINPLRLTQPIDNLPYAVYSEGCDVNGDTDAELLSNARLAASGADAAIVFAGLPDTYESEGFDRDNMRLPDGMNRMIEAVAEANPNTCVVLFCGSPVECPWADGVRAVLYMGLPGQAGGEAVAELIYGRACPGGRLAESWPVRYSDCPSSGIYSKTRDALYMEGVYVGYRYYSSAHVHVRWPFGHGLGYTKYEYSNLSVEGRTVSVELKNVGAVAAPEVVQLYVSPPEGTSGRPELELKRYKKLTLKPGESAVVSFELDERCFAFWRDGWRVQTGEYTVRVGSSSAVLPLSAAVFVEGEETAPAPLAGSWYATLAGKPDTASWEALLGRKYEPYTPKKGFFTMNNTPHEMREHSVIMRMVYNTIILAFKIGYGRDGLRRPECRMMLTSSAMAPLRSMQISGRVPEFLLRALLFVANGFKPNPQCV